VILLKQWTKDIEIYTSIEQIWELFDGSLENMQKIMPQVIEQTAVKVTENRVGTVYRQKFKEGKRIAEYDVETLEYLDSPDHKKLKVGFTLGNFFEITAFYEIKKITEHKTLFRYTATNRPLKAIFKLFLFFANDKEVVQFLNRVKEVAEAEFVLMK
jgi:hypothetical protein